MQNLFNDTHHHLTLPAVSPYTCEECLTKPTFAIHANLKRHRESAHKDIAFKETIVCRNCHTTSDSLNSTTNDPLKSVARHYTACGGKVANLLAPQRRAANTAALTPPPLGANNSTKQSSTAQS
eukprot:GHVN01025289.1.p1 GENE.GHVN01025289.1~~GHVN01025289.1.p1  ORF type:complete len:124 (-),score=10.16 GHVN01025289.1:328-699(-)